MGEGEKVGGIYVDVGADLTQFQTAMDTFEARVSKNLGKKIIAELKLKDSIQASARTIDVIARWQTGTLTSLQSKLNARHLSISVKSATLSAEAIAKLRKSVDDALSGYEANINVKATVTGVDASGHPVKLSGVIAGNPPSVVSASSAAVTQAASAAQTARRPGGRTKAAPAAAPVGRTQAEEAELKALKAEYTQLQKDLGQARKEEEDRRKISARPRVSRAQVGVAQKLTYLTSAINRPELNPEWSRALMGLDTGKAMKPGQFLPAGIPRGIKETIAGVMAASRRSLAMREEEEDAGFGGDLGGERLFRATQGRRGQHGKSKARAKYGAVYPRRTDTRTLAEAQAEQLAHYWDAYEPATRPEGPGQVDLLSEGYLTARQGGAASSRQYISEARGALKERVGGDRGYRKLSRQTHRRQERNIGGEFSQEELDFLAIQALQSEHQAFFAPEAIGSTIGKRAQGGVSRAGVATEAAARGETRRSNRQLGASFRRRIQTPGDRESVQDITTFRDPAKRPEYSGPELYQSAAGRWMNAETKKRVKPIVALRWRQYQAKLSKVLGPGAVDEELGQLGISPMPAVPPAPTPTTVPIAEPTQLPLARQEQEAKAAENVNELTPTSGKGGGGGGILRVHVVNFGELNKLLTGQASQGGLGKLFKTIGASVPRGSVAEKKPQFEGTPAEAAAEMGVTEEGFQAILRGEAQPPKAPKDKRLKRARLGASSFEMTEGGGFVFDPAVYAQQEAKQEAARKRAAEAYGAKQDRDALKAAEADARVQGRAEKDKLRETASAERKASAAAKVVAPKNSADSAMSTYFRQLGLNYVPVRGVARNKERRDPAELALERAQATSTRAEFPERAPSIAFGQLVARGVGLKTRYQQAQDELKLRRDGLQATVEQGRLESEQVGKAKGNLRSFSETTLQKRVAGKLTDEDVRKQRTLLGIYQEHKQARAAIAEQATKEREGVDESLVKVEAAAGIFEKVGNVAALFVGAKAFTTGLTAASAGFDLLGKAVAPEIDRMLDFNAVTTRVTKALAEQARAAGGNVVGVIGGAAAQAGLSTTGAAYIQNALGPSVSAKAGQQTLASAGDLLRASFAKGAPQGLIGGYGGLFGTGFLGSEMGGGKGLDETIASMATDVANMKTSTWPQNRGGRGAPPSQASEATTRANLEAAQKATLALTDTVNGAYKKGVAASDDTTMAAKNLSFEFVGTGAAAEAAKKQFLDLARQVPGALAKATDMVNAGFIVKGLTSGEDYKKFLSYTGTGAPLQDTEVQMTSQVRKAVRIALQRNALGADFAQQYSIPGQFGLGLRAAPLQPVAAGALSPENIKLASKGLQGSLQAQVADAQKARDELTDRAATSWAKYSAKLRESLSSGPASAAQTASLANFDQALKEIDSTAKDIFTNTQAINLAQATYSAHQFANEIRLAKRGLQDALGLAGRAGGSQLGGLQREQFMLGRQSTALGLLLSQRQISYQVALAGFQAPGLTSEERGARIAQAKVEAAIAQKQLDIQKKQFVIAGTEFGITSARGVEDARRAAALAQEGFDTSLKVNAMQANILNASTKQQLAMQLLNSSVGQAESIISTQFDLAAQAAANNLEDVATAAEKVAKALGFAPIPSAQANNNADNWTSLFPKTGTGPNIFDAIDGAKTINTVAAGATSTVNKATVEMINVTTAQVSKLLKLNSQAQVGFSQTVQTIGQNLIAFFTDIVTASQGGTAGTHPRNTGTGHAAGYIGTVSGRTTMTVGEAGDETVAVLRNPRKVETTAFGGSGEMTVQIIFNNPTVRNDDDIVKLAKEVESVMNRKAALIGLRRLG